ncbi:unnamed protein product [Ixodes pacificus]
MNNEGESADSSSEPPSSDTPPPAKPDAYHWDPIAHLCEVSSPQCLLRTKRDVMDIYSEPPPGVFIAPDERNITKIHALVTGPFDTPYEGGFFYFLLKCPSDYPIQPPRVRFMTTDYGSVRFNPNLYRNGKVCLSILGTWTGPAWSPAQSLASVLISIQSLLNENPYYNEPGYDQERNPGDSSRYNDIIQHETIRVAVCSMVEACLSGNTDCPPPLRRCTRNKAFRLAQRRHHECSWEVPITVVAVKLPQDPFGEPRGIFQYSTLLTRLQSLRERISQKHQAAAAEHS